MFDNIVCTIDFSPSTEQVLRCGVRLASGSRLFVFHAVNIPKDPVYPSAEFERGGDLDAKTHQAHRRIEAWMQKEPADYSPLIKYGDPVETLTEQVERHQLDLVVASSRGLSPVKRLVMGTVVERMARSLPCPLLILPPPAVASGTFFEPRQILVACDLYEQSMSLLQAAVFFAHVFDARIQLLYCLQAPVDQKLIDPSEGPYEVVQQRMLQRLEESLRQQAAALQDARVTIDSQVAADLAAEAVPRQARRLAADLIVVGVRHHSSWGKVLMGSTTEAVLRHARCAVLTVPVAKSGPRRSQPQ